MFIKKIIGHYFRNFSHFDFSINSNHIFIKGSNGIGKTNLLESIYFLAFGSGFKKNDNRSLINFEQKQGDLYLEYEDDGVHSISAIIQENKKIFAYDEKKIDKLSSIFGKLLIICYTPTSAYLFKNEPALRRNFIDVLCSQVDNNYLYALQRYKKLLKERNQAFIRDYDQDVINVYAKQLINYAFKIVNFRKKIIENINSHINDYFKNMFEVDADLILKYHTNCLIDDNLDSFVRKNMKLFDDNKSNEHIHQQTLIGPHKDNIKAYLNGKDIAIYGSQGQNRLATLSLQFAKREIYQKYLNKEPILLLDDVLSDLDEKRASNLLKEVNKKGQVIITGTRLVDNIDSFDIYSIRNNNVYKEGENE